MAKKEEPAKDIFDVEPFKEDECDFQEALDND